MVGVTSERETEAGNFAVGAGRSKQAIKDKDNKKARANKKEALVKSQFGTSYKRIIVRLYVSQVNGSSQSYQT